ncbi:MAG: hypothetical protein AAB898_01095, partial [Patescibacteria group bacterium]
MEGFGKRGELVGDGGVKRHALAGDGMVERETIRVEPETTKRETLLVADGVEGIADHGVTEGVKVRADLVRAAGVEKDLDHARDLGAER